MYAHRQSQKEEEEEVMTKRQRREKLRVQAIKYTQEIAKTEKRVNYLWALQNTTAEETDWVQIAQGLTNRQLNHVIDNQSKFPEELNSLVLTVLSERALKLEEEK
jgi:hypothetical protein